MSGLPRARGGVFGGGGLLLRVTSGPFLRESLGAFSSEGSKSAQTLGQTSLSIVAGDPQVMVGRGEPFTTVGERAGEEAGPVVCPSGQKLLVSA